MRGLEYNYDGYLTINGKTQKCYFEYEYKSNFYTLSQSSNGWLLLVTTPKFDIKGLEEKLKQKIEESAMVLLLDDEKLPNMTEKMVFSAQHPQGISEKLYGTPSTENLVLVESDDEKTADIRDVLFGTNKGTYDALFEIVGNKIYKGEVAEENLILVNLTRNWLDEDLTGSVIQKVQNGRILKFSNVKHQNEIITYNTISEGWLDIYAQEIHKGRNKNHLESMASGGLMIHECNVHKSDTYSGNCLVTFNGMVNDENQLFIMEVLNESLYYQYSYKYPMSELKEVYENGVSNAVAREEKQDTFVNNNNADKSSKKETKKEEKTSNNSSSNAKAKNIAIKVKNDTGDEMNVYNQGSGGNYRLQKNIITTIKMDEDDKLYEYNNAKKGRLLLTASPDMDGKVFLISKL